MAWAALLLAGVLETGFAVSLGLSRGFRHPGWTASFVVCAAASFALLSWSLRSLPVGTAYAVWTGIGAVGTALVGVLVLGEPSGALRLLSIGLVVAGVVGLRLTSAA